MVFVCFFGHFHHHDYNFYHRNHYSHHQNQSEFDSIIRAKCRFWRPEKRTTLPVQGRVPKKKSVFLMVFCQTGGWGSARVVKKPYCFFEKVFFQRACRIILGPPKHVLHLVWSAFVIYTAIRTALKVASKARILRKRRSISKNKTKNWNGTKCKICFTHL